jgi:hypothetical protein
MSATLLTLEQRELMHEELALITYTFAEHVEQCDAAERERLRDHLRVYDDLDLAAARPDGTFALTAPPDVLRRVVSEMTKWADDGLDLFREGFNAPLGTYAEVKTEADMAEHRADLRRAADRDLELRASCAAVLAGLEERGS